MHPRHSMHYTILQLYERHKEGGTHLGTHLMP